MKNPTLLPFAAHMCVFSDPLAHLGVALPPPTASRMCWNPCYTQEENPSIPETHQ